MWPSMFGPGWGWDVLVVLAVVMLIGWLFVWVVRPRRQHTVASREDDLWHRYEEGDLTREEFERLRHRRAA